EGNRRKSQHPTSSDPCSPSRYRIGRCCRRINEQAPGGQKQLLPALPYAKDDDADSKPDRMNHRKETRHPEKSEEHVEDGRSRRSDPRSRTGQDRDTGNDQPNSGEDRQDMFARDIFAEGFERLMRGLELPPDKIQNSRRHGRQSVYPNADLDLFELHFEYLS